MKKKKSMRYDIPNKNHAWPFCSTYEISAKLSIYESQ